MRNLQRQSDSGQVGPVSGFVRIRTLHRYALRSLTNSATKILVPAIPSRRCPRGLSLVEMLVALTIMGILTSMALPSFQHAVDQSRADIAGANLRAIWSAERCYWLDKRTYTSNLAELESLGLLDPSIVSSTSFYAYAISAANSSSFTATATRVGSARWSGHFTIRETGLISGTVQATGEPLIKPGFQ